GDYAKFLRALMYGGTFRRVRILSRRSVTALRTVQERVLNSHYDSFGLGLQMGCDERGNSWFGHAGAFPWGWTAAGRAYPELDVIVVGLANKWDMIRWDQPPADVAACVVADFV